MTSVDLSTNQENKAKDCLIRADLHMKSRNFQDAIQAIRDCFALQPNNTDAFILAARIYLKIDQPRDALNVLNSLEKLTPPTETTLLLKAKTYFTLGQYLPCKNCLDEILKGNSAHPGALEIQADIFLMTNKTAEAIQIYEKLLKSDSTNPNLHYSLALAYSKLKDWNETIYYCSQILDNGGTYPPVKALYQRALHEKKLQFMIKRGDISLIQRIYANLFNPITERELRIQSDAERQLKNSNRHGI